jgi:hypothetical protein
MALILVLLTLLLLSAIGMGMMFMADTETTVNTNYHDIQLAFFAMRGGLEEVRDRARSNSAAPLTLPTTMPGNAGSILYLINPAGVADVVDPQNMASAYPDDEYCHESFTGLVLANPGVGVPCTVGPPLADVAPYVNSVSPNNGTASALKFKWARVTLKQNGTFPNSVVDATKPLADQVCWQTANNQEVPLSVIGVYADCKAAQDAGKDASPVYIVTSLAVTPQGSRRMGQYEVGGLTISPPGGSLELDGPGATFTPRPSSKNYFTSGIDTGGAGYAATGGPGACATPAGGLVPGVATGDAAGVASIDASLTANPNRSSNYTGAGGTPSVVNAGAGGTNQFSGTWATPATLDALVASISNMADVAYTCGIGAPCSPAGGVVGTNAAPQITYVNGDFNMGAGSGAGVLVVTGTLSFTGNASFNGLILVIGQGAISESGGGNGGFNGSVFVARTQSATAPYSELGALGAPTFSWNGGGTSFIQYNSCWASVGNKMSYNAIAMREEMY